MADEGQNHAASERPARRWLTPALLVAAFVAMGVFFMLPTLRDVQKAQPLNQPELPNGYRVSDDLYRGACPADAGFERIKAMGVGTVIDLAGFPEERAKAEAAGLRYVAIPIRDYRIELEKIEQFLRIVSDRDRGPFFVHCAQGIYRTGTMVAMYRITVQGWSVESAIDEMENGGFGFEGDAADLADYFRSLDLERFKRVAAGGQ